MMVLMVQVVLGNTPSVSPSQGNPGGATNAPTTYNGAGGGGATASGQDSSAGSAGGAGTAFINYWLICHLCWRGAGGMNSGNSSGGNGGGANGSTSNPGTSWYRWPWGGGAGAGNGPGGGKVGGPGGAGGTGIVILSVPSGDYSGLTTGNPTITNSGSNTILQYTSTGTYTA